VLPVECYAEICQKYAVCFYENILWFNISVAYFDVVNILKSVGETAEKASEE
jgi:hypothetical protein